MKYFMNLNASPNLATNNLTKSVCIEILPGTFNAPALIGIKRIALLESKL